MRWWRFTHRSRCACISTTAMAPPPPPPRPTAPSHLPRRLPDPRPATHGSPAVPPDLPDISTRCGGKMPHTWGVPVEEIQRGIRHGVRKINIDTDNRMAMTGEIRRVLSENPGEFDPRKYLKPAMEAMVKLCRQRVREFRA